MEFRSAEGGPPGGCARRHRKSRAKSAKEPVRQGRNNARTDVIGASLVASYEDARCLKSGDTVAASEVERDVGAEPAKAGAPF
jgi:hypothetical protein